MFLNSFTLQLYFFFQISQVNRLKVKIIAAVVWCACVWILVLGSLDVYKVF